MAERVLDRLFAQAAAAVETQQALDDPERDIQTKEKSSEEEMRKLKTTMTVSDAIRRILLADKDKDYFRCLCPHLFAVVLSWHASSHSILQTHSPFASQDAGAASASD